MTANGSLLAQGIAAARAGDKVTARQLLSRALRGNPDSEAAWLWLGAALDTPQGRAFCLRQALALNPDNQIVQQGLRALETIPQATVLVAQPEPLPRTRAIPQRQQRLAPAAQAPPAAVPRPRRRPWSTKLPDQRRFWRLLVACLGIVAAGLVGVLAYAVVVGSSDAVDDSVAAVLPSPSPAPAGTLRSTFTPTATATPVPSNTPAPTLTATFTPTPTETPAPTETSTPSATPSPTRRRSTKPPPTAVPTATRPPPILPPRSLDPRLASLGVRVEPAPVGPGKPHWYLVEARWADERQAGGKHSIFVEVLNARGERALDQLVIVEWPDGSVALPVEDRPPPDWAVDFGMYNTLGSYAVSVGGGPSDRIVGLGLGTVEDPHMKVHTCFYLVFRSVY